MISCTPQGAFRAWQNDAITNAYCPDIAAEIDSATEEMMERIAFRLRKSLGIRAMPNEMIKIGDFLRVMAEFALLVAEESKGDSAANNKDHFNFVLSKALDSSNPRAVLYGFACAAGLDALNGLRSQAEVARTLGCSRALISHYTTAAADFVSTGEDKFTITKFRKSEQSREVFKRTATDPFTAAKEAAIQKIKQINNN